MSNLNILMSQQFVHLTDTEEGAQEIVETYKNGYTVKQSNIQRKVKKGVEYFVVKVTVTHLEEKDAFDTYFGE